MVHTTFGFIGLGLIGGSIAKSIKRVFQRDSTIVAYDADQDTLFFALEEGTIDCLCSGISAAHFGNCDYVFLCAPVALNGTHLAALKEAVKPDCLITDVGSVKKDIHHEAALLSMEAQFIGGHPMAGSEKTGYTNSHDRLIENAYYILTPTALTTEAQLQRMQELTASLGAIPLVLSCESHDYVTAAVSHLPHIIAAALVNLVRDSDSPEHTMKMIAAGGFKDITRISSSSAAMWQQISLLNKENLEQLLTAYIASLQDTLQHLKDKDSSKLYDLFSGACLYRESFIDSARGPIKKVYSLYVDIPDEAGVIAAIAALLAAHKINLKNIGIRHNREFEEGALCIEFYDENAVSSALSVLRKEHYKIYERK